MTVEGRIAYPRLGLGLSLVRTASVTEEFSFTARIESQARPFVRAILPALRRILGVRWLSRFTDTHLTITCTTDELDVAGLDALKDAIVAETAAIRPPIDGVNLAAWRTAATELGCDFVVGDLSMRGRAGGQRLAIELGIHEGVFVHEIGYGSQERAAEPLRSLTLTIESPLRAARFALPRGTVPDPVDLVNLGPATIAPAVRDDALDARAVALLAATAPNAVALLAEMPTTARHLRLQDGRATIEVLATGDPYPVRLTVRALQRLLRLDLGAQPYR